MRTIKYRGKVDDEWWYLTLDDAHQGEYLEASQFWNMVDRKTVGEWTGLHDANKQEIYENDILGAPGEPRTYFQAVWDAEHLAWAGQSPWAYRFLFVENPPSSSDIVLGNIYDDEELLKNETN